MRTYLHRIFDNTVAFLVLFTAPIFLKLKKKGLENYKATETMFLKFGLYPLRDYYYEPMFDPKHLRHSLRDDRSLHGIDFNVEEQLEVLNSFDYNKELESMPLNRTESLDFYYRNNSFESGDAEFYYSMIRKFKPHKIIEIGSGFSTLLARKAALVNFAEQNHLCEIICIEPYEMQWLDRISNIKVIKKRVELIEKEFFRQLEKDDILFIDSSHMIRPQGDILFEILEILPSLNEGVLIHFHDIFTPKDYLDEWIIKKKLFWNEQYILEAFISFNNKFRIIGSLNFLKHHYFKELSHKCPILKIETEREPGSFWIIKK